MNLLLLYSLISVGAVSIISLIGILTLSIKAERLKTVLIYLISFSAGSLFGDAFIHLLPELVEETGGLGLDISLYILCGILIFFILEKVIHWQHCHMPITKTHIHPFAYTNLVGDGLHNFIDGMIIAGSYLVSIPAGIATTIAVALHEIPQEIGDFGVLLHGGFSRGQALLVNFASALTALVGVTLVFLLSGTFDNLISIIVPIAIGGFLYIAGSDLIPELHKESVLRKSIMQIIMFVLGILVMVALLALE
ncbi:MAG: ZIP family metal transporter [Nanoarchaeota archaeon]|nr:ZIP family metal transporter [Nanoarchaeota archaeon]